MADPKAPQVRFLEAFEVAPAGLGKARFNLKGDHQEVARVTLIGDPTLDGPFPTLFTDADEIGGLTGPKRLISLLNGLFYPSATKKEEQIRNVFILDPELHPTGSGGVSLRTLSCDLRCKCECWKLGANGEKEESSVTEFDLAMQRGRDESLHEWLQCYASAMRVANRHVPIKAVALLNARKQGRQGEDDSFEYGMGKIEIRDGREVVTPAPGMLDLYCLDLEYQAIQVRIGRPIFFGGKELGPEGVEWVKLLSIRHWANKLCGSDQKFPVPRKSASQEAVNSAFVFLSLVSDHDLARAAMDEFEREKMLSSREKKGREQGREQGRQEALNAVVKRLRAANIPDEDISIAVGMSIEQF
jgi:hypothetical protein